MPHTRTALGLAGAFVILAGSPSKTDAGDSGDMSWVLGSPPMFCALVGGGRQLCTWHVGNSFHLVCELDGDGKTVGDPCVRRDDNVSMSTFSRKRSKFHSGTRRRKERREAGEEAIAELDEAQSLRQVVELVGAGPRWCHSGASLTCTWHLVRRTPGYITIARVANAPGKKLDLICRFNESGETRDDGSCRAGVAGRSPSN